MKAFLTASMLLGLTVASAVPAMAQIPDEELYGPDVIGQGVNTARTVTTPSVPNHGTDNAGDNGGLGLQGHTPGGLEGGLGHGRCTAGKC